MEPDNSLARSSVKTQRFFIALVPPTAIQDDANGVRQEFADRFNSRKAFNSPPHITLQPPFHWPLAAVDQLTTAVANFACRQPPFPVQLQGFEAFPPRVIYIDVDKSPALIQLQASLAEHLADRCDIRDRNAHRPYCPHMTVAFRDLTRSAFRQAWPEFEQRPYEASFTVDQLTLLIHRQRWEVYESFGLG